MIHFANKKGLLATIVTVGLIIINYLIESNYTIELKVVKMPETHSDNYGNM
jgi:hypothetical protein